MTGPNRCPVCCPVCGAPDAEAFFADGPRRYFRCAACAARFLDPRAHPRPEEERAQYDTHENSLDDPGYRAFLARLATPLLARLAPGAAGLDYGCGPGPALAQMLRAAGHPMALWDPFYAPDPAPLAGRYDFVTCTEVVEHFHRPAQEFDRLGALLRPGGIIAVMTQFQTDDARFGAWHYRLDPTHVVFYRPETLARIAALRGWRAEIIARNVVFLTV